MKHYRAYPGDPVLEPALELIRRAFAGMEGRIDPPSSMHRLSVETLEEAAAKGEFWVVGSPPLGCVLYEIKGEVLYLSKLAVDTAARRNGIARRLVLHAEERARVLGLIALELSTRIELTENHKAFERLGFSKWADFTHPGYDRPTSVTMRKPIRRPDVRG